MKFNRIFIIVGVIALLIFLIFLLATKFESARSHDELVVGTASGYAPYVSLNSQGEYEGFDIDIAKEIAQRMNKKLVIEDQGSMIPLLLSLKQNKVDIVIWALEINKTRLAEMEMIHYSGGNTTSYPLVFWNEIPASIKTIDDLKNIKNATICIEPGSSQERFLNKFDFITKKSMEKVVDMIMDIKYGKSLAVLLDPSLIKNLKIKNPELKVLDVQLDQDSMSFGNGICIRKDNTAMIAKIKEIVAAMKSDGTIVYLQQKWNLE